MQDLSLKDNTVCLDCGYWFVVQTVRKKDEMVFWGRLEVRSLQSYVAIITAWEFIPRPIAKKQNCEKQLLILSEFPPL